MTKEGSYLRGQESSNGFKFSNGCIVEIYLNGFGPFAKKKNEDLMFFKHCDWIIFLQVSWYKYPAL